MTKQAWMRVSGAAFAVVALTVLAGCCALDRPAPAPAAKVAPAQPPGSGR